MRGADQRFPMQPYRVLFAVTHRNESGTGFKNHDAFKILILRDKTHVSFAHIMRIPTAAGFEDVCPKMVGRTAKW